MIFSGPQSTAGSAPPGHASRFTFHVSRTTHHVSPAPRAVRAFTLLEVMIASGIFFMAMFAILALVAGTLRNARGLQRGDVDAGMAAAQIIQLLKTNRQTEVTGSGDFGDAYRDFSYEFESTEAMTNGLLKVDIVVNRRGTLKPFDTLTIWIYAPDAKSGYGTHL